MVVRRRLSMARAPKWMVMGIEIMMDDGRA